MLVILGILAAIVLPKFTNRTKQAQIAAVQTQIASFKTALDAYEVDNGNYPRGKNGLLDLIQQPRDVPELARAVSLVRLHPQGSVAQ